MEADWEFEVGPEAPVIDALWPGFVDLRRTPERISEIEEARQFPALAETLLLLNGPDLSLDRKGGHAASISLVWTAKCDLWTPDPRLDRWDPDEMDADSTESTIALACYIDLLPRNASVFAGLNEAETWARATVTRLRKIPSRCCRTDLAIRRAVTGEQDGFGITSYILACGADNDAAQRALSGALVALVKAIHATNSRSVSGTIA